jgi:hypothetical protein
MILDEEVHGPVGVGTNVLNDPDQGLEGRGVPGVFLGQLQQADGVVARVRIYCRSSEFSSEYWLSPEQPSSMRRNDDGADHRWVHAQYPVA